MPLESTSSFGSKPYNKAEKTRRLTSLVEDFAAEDAPFRQRLHLLFSQIEKEFELLYLENLSCKSSMSSIMYQ